MPMKNSEETEQEDIGPYPMFDPGEFTKFGTRNLLVATHTARVYYSGLSKLNQEMMSFFNGRVKKNLESARSFMASKSSKSAFHAQAEYVEGAIRDYADEASKIMHLAADIAHETLAPIEERTEEMLQRIDESSEKAEQQAAAE